MKSADIYFYLGEVPISKRHDNDLEEFGIELDYLTVYHITASENIEDIRQNGLKAKTCRQSYERPAAVYFFGDFDEINTQNIDILGYSKGYQILTIRVPKSEIIRRMQWDGLYNMDFSTRSALQFLGNVPADWIISYDTREAKNEN